MKPRKRALSGTQPRWHPDLRLPASRTMRKYISVVSVHGILLSELTEYAVISRMASDIIITYRPQMDRLSLMGGKLLEGRDNESVSHTRSGCPLRTPPVLCPGWDLHRCLLND